MPLPEPSTAGVGSPRLSVVIVAWNSRAELARTLPALLPELGPGDELIVVDNGSEDGSAELTVELAPAAGLIAMAGNTGFAAGSNAGAAAASGDLLVFLNPDAAPMPGWGEAIRGPLAERRGWHAWQGLVACDGGRTVNSAGNPVHFTGIVWAGGHGQPLSTQSTAGEVAALSGACLAIPRSIWESVGGFPAPFFLYHEDVDLSLRLRLGGGLIGIEPGAVVDHEYEFGGAGGGQKWRWLERNRWACLLRTYPGPLLAVAAPALLAAEPVLLIAALRGGWLGQKLRSYADLLRWLPRLLAERRRLQAGRAISAADFAAPLSAELDSHFIPAAARSRPVRLALRLYWRAARRLL